MTDGYFHIDGVTGPDEYSALSDDNTYTNLMAAANLRESADCAQGLSADISEEELESWRGAAQAISIPLDQTGVPEQARGYHQRELWDFERTAREETYPLLLHRHYMDLYRKQIVKQSDLMLALHLFGSRFTLSQIGEAFAHYELLTVRDSSLSACTQADVAAHVGQFDLSYRYLNEGAQMDLADRERNTADGLHLASLAGVWISLISGFAGMRDYFVQLSFTPQLPPQLASLSFSLRWHGARSAHA